MKSKRFTFIVMLFLACFAMVSIGFATWTISLNKPIEENASGTVDTDDVINSDDYVTIEIDNSRMFRYCRYGFVLNNNVVSNGILPIKITLHNLNAFKDKFKNEQYDSIAFVIALKYDNSKVDGESAYTLFDNKDNCYSFSKQFKEDINEPYHIDTQTNGKVISALSSNVYTITLKLDNLINDARDTYSFGIDYSFNVLVNDNTDTQNINEMYDYFLNHIYNTIHRKNLFSVTCKISGYKVDANGEQ